MGQNAWSSATKTSKGVRLEGKHLDQARREIYYVDCVVTENMTQKRKS